MTLIKLPSGWKRSSAVKLRRFTEVLNHGQWLNNNYKPTITPASGVTVTQPAYVSDNYVHGLILTGNINGDVTIAFPSNLTGRKIYIFHRSNSNGNMNDAYINWSDGTSERLTGYYGTDYTISMFEVKDLTFNIHFHGNNKIEFGAIVVEE